MTRLERLLTPSAAVCCVCEHELSVQELEEFYVATEEELHDEIYCRACMEQYFVLCRECSGRYTVQGECRECKKSEDPISNKKE